MYLVREVCKSVMKVIMIAEFKRGAKDEENRLMTDESKLSVNKLFITCIIMAKVLKTR